MLELENVTIRYSKGAPIFEDLSLQVREGKITVLLGANDVGKTSIFRAFCGLLPPVKGTVTSPSGKDIGLTINKPALHPWLTVEKNWSFGVSYVGQVLLKWVS